MKIQNNTTSNANRFNPYRIFLGSFIPNWLLQRPDISHGAKLTYARLCQYAGKNGVAFPKQETLATELGISARMVRNYIEELIQNKLIETEQTGKRQSNKYYFLKHEWIKGDRKDIATHKVGCVEESFHNDRQDIAVPSIKRISEENHNAVSAFKDYYKSKYQVRFNEPYLFNHARDGKLIKEMLESVNLETLKAKADKFLSLNDDYLKTNGYTIPLMKSGFNKLTIAKASAIQKPRITDTQKLIAERANHEHCTV